MIEEALKLANIDALQTHTALSVTVTTNDTNIASSNAHPLLSKLKISSVEMTALKDFTKYIHFSQAEKEKQVMVNTKGSLVHAKSPRCIENLVADHQHIMWAVGNTNLLAPISLLMWNTWVGISDLEIEQCKKQTLNNVGILRALVELLRAFPLNMFKHSKCTTIEVKLYIKQDMSTCYNRKEFHLTKLWNAQRSYMRCLCNPRVVSGYKGSIIWFDHVIWTMINKLDIFFPNQSTKSTRFTAFMLWLSSAAKITVKAVIVFHIEIHHIVTAATQLAKNPIHKLLPNLNDIPLAIKIERFL